jgi:hypothetical protein
VIEVAARGRCASVVPMGPDRERDGQPADQPGEGPPW